MRTTIKTTNLQTTIAITNKNLLWLFSLVMPLFSRNYVVCRYSLVDSLLAQLLFCNIAAVSIAINRFLFFLRLKLQLGTKWKFVFYIFNSCHLRFIDLRYNEVREIGKKDSGLINSKNNWLSVKCGCLCKAGKIFLLWLKINWLKKVFHRK